MHHYGCANCHAIAGITEPASCPDLSQWGQVRVERLDFGQFHGSGEILESRLGWLITKLRSPRIFDRGRTWLDPQPGNPGQPYAKLRMPQFFLKPDQIDALATFVLSNRAAQVSQGLVQKANPPTSQAIARGTRIIETYNCGGCHDLGGNTPSISQYWRATIGLYPREDMQQRGPPPLRGEGARVQHRWLHEFLGKVEGGGTGPQGRIRPLPFVRMPSFALTDTERTLLVEYFSAAANRDADAATVFVKDHSGPLRPDDPISMSVFDAHIIAAAFRNIYPFEASARPAPPPERFNRGERLFHLAQCQLCHVVGDESAVGVNSNPKGPNLGNIHRRIRPEWARRWIQEPQVIYPSGPMPSIFFSGRAALDPAGVPLRPEKALPEDLIRSHREFGASAEEQIRLLLDFLYAAGVSGYTSKDPPAARSP